MNKIAQKEKQELLLLEMVSKKRKRMPKLGSLKLYDTTKQDLMFSGIKIGRDKFYQFLKANGLLIRKTKRAFITTDSKHHFYKSPNLLKELNITHSEQVFVNDITYIEIDGGHAYSALVTDAYSKKIMGYSLQNNMKVEMVKEALRMALNNRSFKHQNIIHHSDRGIQYCCPDYSNYAEERGMILSTTQQYDPYENAVAERINGILKYEFGLGKKIPNLKTAQMMLKQAVDIYNNERPHFSLKFKTPSQAHEEQSHFYKSYKKERTNKLSRPGC